MAKPSVDVVHTKQTWAYTGVDVISTVFCLRKIWECELFKEGTKASWAHFWRRNSLAGFLIKKKPLRSECKVIWPFLERMHTSIQFFSFWSFMDHWDQSIGTMVTSIFKAILNRQWYITYGTINTRNTNRKPRTLSMQN